MTIPSAEEEEENVQKIKKKKKKKKKPFETERMSMKDDDGHCGLACLPKQPKMVPKQHRELNSIIDNQSVLTATNRRDHFTPFASNLHNKILLKRICIKAGNNARFFLSKTSKAFRKVTLREFGVMTSSNIEQGRVKAVKISEIETPAQFVLCVEHGLQLNDLVFAALADGGQLNVLKYLHDHLLPDKMYHCSLAVEYAAQNNHLETLKYLIEYHDAPVCKDACWRAAWKGSLECLEYLVLVRRCPFDRQECHDIAYRQMDTLEDRQSGSKRAAGKKAAGNLTAAFMISFIIIFFFLRAFIFRTRLKQNAVYYLLHTYFHELSLPGSAVTHDDEREKKASSTDNNENKNDIIKPENVIARLAQCKPLKSVNPRFLSRGQK